MDAPVVSVDATAEVPVAAKPDTVTVELVKRKEKTIPADPVPDHMDAMDLDPAPKEKKKRHDKKKSVSKHAVVDDNPVAIAPAPVEKKRKKAPNYVDFMPKKRPADTESGSLAPAPAPKKHTSSVTPIQDARPIPTPLKVEGMSWPLGTRLKWPGTDVVMVVNDVFRALTGAHTDEPRSVAHYRELLALENDEIGLLIWGNDRRVEFIAMMHLLQTLTPPPGKENVPIPAGPPLAMWTKFDQKIKAAGLNKEITLDQRYIPKGAAVYQALPSLVQLANELTNEQEPRGGHPMHAFVTRTDITTKNLTSLLAEFTFHYANDTRTAQEQAGLVVSAFKALFY